MFQLSGMIEMFNVDNESDSANAVCPMNVSTVSSVMDISVKEGNYNLFLYLLRIEIEFI